VRPTEFPESRNSIFLTHFQGEQRPRRSDVIDHLGEVRQDALIDFEELFSGGFVESEHLEGGDLKALIKDLV